LRSNLANDPGHLLPESASLTFDSGTFSAGGDVLAREAASDDVHESTPRSPVEGLHIVPDREGWQRSVVLSGHEHAPAVFFDFDGADCPPPEKMASKDSTPSARE
jgi:hypothetical protein